MLQIMPLPLTFQVNRHLSKNDRVRKQERKKRCEVGGWVNKKTILTKIFFSFFFYKKKIKYGFEFYFFELMNGSFSLIISFVHVHNIYKG